MRKDILIISNYFPPESGAASNRIYTLATSLTENNYEVTVVCPLPNYPFGKIFDTHKGKRYSKTIENNLIVYRLWLFASNSKNKFVRLFSMLSFAIHLFFFLLFKKTPKKVLIQCSPLFVGFFGVLISKIKRKKIILNVSDLWPLAGLEMGLLNKGRYYSILEKIELFNYRNSDLLIGQSQEILDHFKKCVPSKESFLYRNYPNFDIKPIQENTDTKTLKIVYAGLLGIAQGVLNLCKELNLPDNVELHIYGNGPETNQLIEYIKNKKNIIYHGSVERAVLHQELRTYDLTLIPLINRIYGSVPSKIFEYARLGLPILYFSDGEGNEIVKKHQLGLTINSLDYNALNNVITDLAERKITLPKKGGILKIAESEFNLAKQFKHFIIEIEKC
ncbi:MAG: glycosyltransferase WbuB [Kordia sp.]|nr:MAG: glycosyltransferase WbuB [Kordia sp.]